MPGHFVFGIRERARTRCLDERVDAAFHKAAVAADAGHEHGRIAREARHVDAVGRAEIAEAVGDQVAFVAFYGPDDVGAVAEHDVGAQVDAVVGEDTQVAAVFAQIGLGAVRQVRVLRALGPAVEVDHEDVALRAERGHDPRHRRSIGMLERVGVLPEGADAVADAILLHDDALAVGQAAVGDALLLEDFTGAFAPVRAEVVGVVVGQVEVVEAGFGEQVREAFRGAERVGVGLAHVLGAFAAVADHAFEVAGREVGGQEERLHVGEDIRATVLRQADGGVVGAHHDVAAHGDGQQRVGGIGRHGGLSHGAQGGQGEQQGEQGAFHRADFLGGR